MERQSPPTERVIAILDLLASNPGNRLPLSELARKLGLSKATCLGVVNTLTNAGYLTRHPDDKTYSLGAALLLLGRSAEAGFASLDLARPHLQRLTDEHGVPTTASKVIRDSIVILDRTAPPGGSTPLIHTGQRYPAAPPVGVVAAVWGDDHTIEDWLGEYPNAAIDRQRLRDLVDSCRTHGYFVERLSDLSAANYQVFAGLASHDLPPSLYEALNTMIAAFAERYYTVTEVRAPGRHPVAAMAASTYSAQGTPDLLLGFLVEREAVPAKRIRRLGEALASAAAAITDEVGGRNPWSDGDPPPCRIALKPAPRNTRSR